VEETEFTPGAIAEFIDDPDRWGIVKSVSDCGECVYLKRFGKGAESAIGYSGVSRNLLRTNPKK
jgi:hypothetical protein